MTHLIDARPRTAASPDILIFPGDPGWGGVRRGLGIVDRTPAAIALPRTAADVIALVEHAETVGLEIAVQGGDQPGMQLDGTLLVSLRLVAARELEIAVATLAATPRRLR
jgi:hypothetical protein